MAKTVDTELQELQKYPFGTKKHEELLTKIQNKYLSKYENQFILCTRSKFKKDLVVPNFNGVYVLNDDNDIIVQSLKDYPFENKQFYYVDRKDAEWNMQHRQLIVNVFVVNEDSSKAIVLQENNGKISLVGGHVDFHSNDYHNQIDQVLRYNMIKETNEEVGNATYITANTPQQPSFVVSCNDTYASFYDNMHIFFVYLVRLSNADFAKQADIMRRKERKHKPVVANLEEILRKTSKESVRKIARHIMGGAKIKQNYPETTPTSNVEFKTV